jgi:fructose-1,6-bisphosphatase I
MEAKALAQQIPESTNVMSAQAVSLTRYLLGHEAKNPELGSEFCHFMAQLAFAAKIMAHQVMRAGLVGKLGLTGARNASGDAQKMLDVFTNDTMIAAFARTGLVAEIVSEELEVPKRVPGGADARFVLCTDPLDGSANTDTNGAVGTIFSLYRRRGDTPREDLRQVSWRGSEHLNRSRRVT